MYVCKKCGKEGPYLGDMCQFCGEAVIFDRSDIELARRELEDAISSKNNSRIAELYHILADSGEVDAQREYAKILSEGKHKARDYDTATEYYYRATKQNDPESAYRYSRLVGRENERTGRFFLIYSAILGYEGAFSPLADEFSAMGLEEDAHYFYYLAAESGRADTIVAMAERYYYGKGTEKSCEYAKWYMDKLNIPPIYAIKLAYKLRSYKATKPEKPTLKNYSSLLARLMREAREAGFDTAEYYLASLLAENGDEYALSRLGELLILGCGCEKNEEAGVKCLTRAAEYGSADANLILGDLYVKGDVLSRDVDRALNYYNLAAELGYYEGFERAADIYYTGVLKPKNRFLASELYEKAADLGGEDAKNKLKKMESERDEYLSLALTAQRRGSFDDAFNHAAHACDLGSAPAATLLGKYFSDGLGIEENKKTAFLWYRFAYERGEKNAIFPLAECYELGLGTNRNYDEAIRLYKIALSDGIELSRDRIDGLMKKKLGKVRRRLYSTAMRLVHKRKFKDALNYLEIARDVETPEAIYTLGCFYEFGIRVPCDKEYAFSLYEAAYAMGFRDPRANYKLKVLKMIR